MGTGLGSSAAVAAPSSGGMGGKRREYLVGFAVSSASPALAAVATNPIEVVKVRQQIDTAYRCYESKDKSLSGRPVHQSTRRAHTVSQKTHRCGSRPAALRARTPAEAWRAR